MLTLNRRTKIYGCVTPTDMRKSFDSLFAMARDVLNRDPMSGHVFLFVNRKRTTCKALYWDGTGLVLLSERLEDGTFTRFNEAYGNIEMTEAEFALFVEGADLNKRFIESRKEFCVDSQKRVAL